MNTEQQNSYLRKLVETKQAALRLGDYEYDQPQSEANSLSCLQLDAECTQMIWEYGLTDEELDNLDAQADTIIETI